MRAGAAGVWAAWAAMRAAIPVSGVDRGVWVANIMKTSPFFREGYGKKNISEGYPLTIAACPDRLGLRILVKKVGQVGRGHHHSRRRFHHLCLRVSPQFPAS